MSKCKQKHSQTNFNFFLNEIHIQIMWTIAFTYSVLFTNSDCSKNFREHYTIMCTKDKKKRQTFNWHRTWTITKYKNNVNERLKTSHSRKKLADGTNFAEPVIAGFFGIITNTSRSKIICHISKTSLMLPSSQWNCRKEYN